MILLRKGDQFLNKKGNALVTIAEIKDAWTCETWITAVELARKLACDIPDLNPVRSYNLLIEFIGIENSDKIQILKGGLKEKRDKIIEQQLQIQRMRHALNQARGFVDEVSYKTMGEEYKCKTLEIIDEALK